MWSDLSARHLLAFRAVVDEGTFGRAAERLGFTQSAVSQQIAALEAMVGHSLFDRPGGPHPPLLTPAGELLLGFATDVLGRLAHAEGELDRLARGVTGSLSVGTFQSISARILPTALRELYREAPGIEVELAAEEEQGCRLDAIINAELDLSFLVADSEQAFDDFEHLRFAYLGADPHVAIVPADHPKGPISLTSLSGAPLVGQPIGDTCGLIIDRSLERFGVTTNYAFRTHDNAAVQGLVGAGVGTAIVPLLTVDPSDPATSIRLLDPPIPPRHLAVVWDRQRSLAPVAARFVELTVEACAELLSAAPLPEA